MVASMYADDSNDPLADKITTLAGQVLVGLP
jgi:hypothetical protein